jgi:hypothetical protein
MSKLCGGAAHTLIDVFGRGCRMFEQACLPPGQLSRASAQNLFSPAGYDDAARD